MSHPALPTADATFAAALAESPRGPERDGVFALWLVVRAALGAALPLPPPRQAERLRALAARLRSLNAPRPLLRSLSAAIGDLAAPEPSRPSVVLAQLVAPTADCLDKRLAEAVLALSRAARAAPRS